MNVSTKFAKAIQWISICVVLLCGVGYFVLTDLFLKEPLVPRQVTANVVEWNYKDSIHYITPNEEIFWRVEEIASVLFVGLAFMAYRLSNARKK